MYIRTCCRTSTQTHELSSSALSAVIYTYTHICMYKCMLTHYYIHTHTYIYVHTHTHTCTCTVTKTLESISCAHTYTHIYICICTLIRSHANTHTNTHIHTHAVTQTPKHKNQAALCNSPEQGHGYSGAVSISFCLSHAHPVFLPPSFSFPLPSLPFFSPSLPLDRSLTRSLVLFCLLSPVSISCVCARSLPLSLPLSFPVCLVISRLLFHFVTFSFFLSLGGESKRMSTCAKIHRDTRGEKMKEFVYVSEILCREEAGVGDVMGGRERERERD